MANLKAHLSPYCLNAALAMELAGDRKCLVINVGRNEKDESVASLRHVTDKVNDCLVKLPELTSTAEKLYIIGSWNLSHQEADVTEALVGEPYTQVVSIKILSW